MDPQSCCPGTFPGKARLQEVMQSVWPASHHGACVTLQMPPLQGGHHHQEQGTFYHQSDISRNVHFPNVYSLKPPSLLQCHPSVRLRLGSASYGNPRAGLHGRPWAAPWRSGTTYTAATTGWM